MLIDQNALFAALRPLGITGVLHIGAHNCEEMPFYERLGVSRSNMLWLDAVPEKVVECGMRGIPNMYHALVTDQDDVRVAFNVSNNVQSSSVLELNTHKTEHPHVSYVRRFVKSSITVDTFMARNGLDARVYNMWNFDIQGAELMALKGAPKSLALKELKAVYLEVNERELYAGCGLIGEVDALMATHGFGRAMTAMTVHGWGDALYLRTDPANNPAAV